MRLGVSSVVKDVGWLVGKAAGEEGEEHGGDGKRGAAFGKVVKRFAEARELGVYAIMTTSTSERGEFQRELLLWTRDQGAREMMESFVQDAREQLGLEDWAEGGLEGVGEGFEVWWQRRAENSRKQVGPLLRKAMSK